MPPANPRVFISYSHDSAAHCDRVLALAQQLRRDGVDAELDQFHSTELLHWPRWCEEQMRPDNADFVLCVCTAEYARRVEGRVPADVGRGVFWEGGLIYNALYDAKGNPRHVPLLLDGVADSDIPRVLRHYTGFRLEAFGLDDAGYAQLYRLLTGQPGLAAAGLGAVVELPPLPEAGRVTDFIALVAAGLERVENVQHQHSGSLARIENRLDRLWQWLKRWRVWLLVLLLALSGLGAVAWWTLPTLTAQAVAYQFNAKAVAARLRDEIEQRFQKDLDAAHQAGKTWDTIRELEKNRDAALNRVDDIVAFIEQGLAGSPDPIFKEATRLLQLQGGDAALAYLESHRTDSLARADQYAQQAEAAQEKLHASLRPLLLEAGLRQRRQEWDAALKLLQAVADKAPQWWEARVQLGTQLLFLARHDEAETQLRAAAALAVDERDQAVALTKLAELLKDMSRFAEAEPLVRKALAIDEKYFGPKHPQFAADINNLAHLLKATNRLADAEPLMRRALAIDENSLGREHPLVARDLNNLSALLRETNRLAEAEPLMRKALAISEKSLGSEHPLTNDPLKNLAQLLQDTNRLADAEPLMRKALAIDEKIFGQAHPAVAQDLNNLAMLLMETNRLAEAKPLMRRALVIFRESYGAEHPKVATGLNNLAGLLIATNQSAAVAAEPLVRRALAIDEKFFGPEHPAVAQSLNNLARLLKDLNRLAEVEPLMRKSLIILLKFTRTTGHEHPNLRMAIGNYQQMLAQTGKTPKQIAERLAETAQQAGYTAQEWQKLMQEP